MPLGRLKKSQNSKKYAKDHVARKEEKRMEFSATLYNAIYE